MKQYKTPGGFTLPEMLITMGIAAIVLSTAVPSISSTIKDNRLVNHLNAVMTDIYFARSEAAKRDSRIILCRSNNTSASVPSCGGDTRLWSTGYIIFADDGNYSNNIWLLRSNRYRVWLLSDFCTDFCGGKSKPNNTCDYGERRNYGSLRR